MPGQLRLSCDGPIRLASGPVPFSRDIWHLGGDGLRPVIGRSGSVGRLERSECILMMPPLSLQDFLILLLADFPLPV